MDIGETIIYTIILLAFIGLMGLVGYLTYDYLEYKKQLSARLLSSSKDINYNFDLSSSNFDLLDERITIEKARINTNSSDIKNNSNRITDTSNILANRITNNSNYFLNASDSFDTNLKRFFTFKDGDASIGNNKIFNYVFGATAGSEPKIDLIRQTTAVGGMTIVTAANTDFKVCNTGVGTSQKCISMNTDADGNFSMLPTSANSLTIKNNDSTVLAKFDTMAAEKAIYLGGVDTITAPLYIKGGNVYTSNLKLVSSPADMINMMPLNTIYTIKNTPGTTTGKVNNKISITISFQKSYPLETYNQIFFNIPYINTKVITLPSPVQISTSKPINDDTTYLYAGLTKTGSINHSDKITAFSKDSLSITINKEQLPTIEQGYVLELIINIVNSDNITTLSDTADTSFISNSFFGL